MSTFKLSGGIRLAELAVDPSNPQNGLIYYNVTTNKFRFYQNGTWKDAATEQDIPAGFITATDDTNSIDLTVSSGELTADLKLSAEAADIGKTKVDLSIETDGLLAQVTIPDALPDQAGHNGQFLKTNGSVADWAQPAISDISGLQTALDDKADDTDLDGYIEKPATPNDNDILAYDEDLDTWVAVPAPSAPVTSVNGQTGAVTLDAADIDYDNATSGLTATDVQTAIDELDGIIDALPDPIVYVGTWNASTNTPALANSDTGKTGNLYRVTVAGSVDFGAGLISFDIGDSVVNNGTVWEKWDHSDQVQSVNGQTGAVSLDLGDLADVDAASPGDGQVLTWNDGDSKWEAATPAPGYTDEEAQDAVGGILDNGTVGTVNFSYDDGSPAISATLVDQSVTSNKLDDDINVAGIFSRGDRSNGSLRIREIYHHYIQLDPSVSNEEVTQFSFNTGTWGATEITYYLKSNSQLRLGTLRVTSNGTDVSILDTYTDTSPVPVTFSAAMDGAICVISWTNGSANSGVMRADVKLFRT